MNRLYEPGSLRRCLAPLPVTYQRVEKAERLSRRARNRQGLVSAAYVMLPQHGSLDLLEEKTLP